MKKFAVLLMVLILSPPALADTRSRPMPMMGMDMPMMEQMMMKAVGPGLMAGCHADFEALGVSPEVREAIEEKRFELQKEVIRSAADLKIAEMELSKLLEKRGFDAEAASKKLKEAGSLEMKIRKAHLDFLQFLSTKLTDEEWKKLKAHMDRGMGSMMDKSPMPARPMMMEKSGMDMMMMDKPGMGMRMMEKSGQMDESKAGKTPPPSGDAPEKKEEGKADPPAGDPHHE